MLTMSRKIGYPCLVTRTPLTRQQNAFEIFFCLGGGAVWLDTGSFWAAGPHLGDGGNDGLQLGAGSRVSGSTHSRFFLSSRTRHMGICRSGEMKPLYFLNFWHVLYLQT